MYGCESWIVKKAERRRIDAFELWCWRRLLRVPWTARRSTQSILKEISPGISLEAETPVLWPPHVKNWLIGKDSDAGRDWGQEEKGMTEDEMAGWHHWLDGCEYEWTPGVGVGQGGLACCDSWGLKELDTTEWLNWIAQVKKELYEYQRVNPGLNKPYSNEDIFFFRWNILTGNFMRDTKEDANNQWCPTVSSSVSITWDFHTYTRIAYWLTQENKLF